jgi:LysR family transcriptional activator of glutamate synthase operon
MEYKQLEFFLAVCEQNSFRRAAETCFVSQQAISKSLANLEQELGVQLFVRSSDGVTLTEAGRLLEQQVRPHLNERDEIRLQLRQFHAQPQLRIGYFMGLLQELPPHFFIPTAAPGGAAAFPQLYRQRAQPQLSELRL